MEKGNMGCVNEWGANTGRVKFRIQFMSVDLNWIGHAAEHVGVEFD